jgi:hypothetical protein
MPPVRKNAGEPIDCSKRSVNPFQTYVNHIITKNPDKIKLLLARALMNDDSLMDFSGQVHANECVFSYPNSNWYSVYLLNDRGEKYFGETGAQKFYFQLDIKLNKEGIPVDAFPMNPTFETPDELIVNGVEMKNCIVKENGKCGNPESKKKKKKTTLNEEDYEEEEQGETSEAILASLSKVSGTTGKQKMPRDYFESLGSKSLIIDWMIANMKPGEIFKCIQRGSLSAEDVQQAQTLLGTMPSSSEPSGASQSEINAVIQSFSPSEIHGMIRVVTKEELIAAANRIKNKDQRKKAIVGMCKRSGIKKYRYKEGKNGKPGFIIDQEDDPVDEQDVLEECAIKEEKRLKKILKITSISQQFKKLSKEDLMDYQGGNVPLPYSMMTYVKRYFPLIKNYENRGGKLYASIPSVREDDTLYYFKVDDILGKDLRKLDKKIQSGEVSFGRRTSFGRKRSTKKVKKGSLKSLKQDLRKVKSC